MKTIEHMTGKQMALAVLKDPQFKMPTYPRVSEGFRFIYLNNNRLLINGGPEKQLFRGNSIHNILPYVINICDGTISLQEILNSGKYPSHDIFQVLSLLYARGLLQEGTPNEIVKNHPLYGFFDRMVDGTRVNKNVNEAINKFTNTTLLIDYLSLETRTLAEKFGEYLTPYGMGIEVNNLSKKLDDKDRETLIIGICTNEEEIPHWKEKVRTYLQDQIPFLFLWFRGDNLIVGPYVDKSETICFECFTDQIDRLQLTSLKKETSLNQYLIGLSLVVPVITNIVSKIETPLLTSNNVELYDLNTLNKKTFLFTLSINCGACSPQFNNCDDNEKVNLVSQYESMVEFPSRKHLNLKAHQNHYSAKNLNLTQEFKNYFSSPKLNLMEFVNEEIDSSISKLVTCMKYTTGIKETTSYQVKRWCPTGGNLGSVNLYYANSKIKNLNKSIYYYQPMENELQQLNEKLNHQDIINIFSQDDEDVIGYFILTGNIQKVATKYRQLSFRLANLDAGVAMAQCQLVAHKLNWKVSRLESYDEESINNLLGLYDIGEIVTIVLKIREGNKNESFSK
ncbi:SagB family peptide dehydrogenase [Lysinibacillus sp. NPDC093688]|uniref:SagB family peptide dehydrogenase n=1 Tax=Lysinibacillus sp. NPDC093688 TaxID=3390577 RepID=UPI003D01CAD5